VVVRDDGPWGGRDGDGAVVGVLEAELVRAGLEIGEQIRGAPRGAAVVERPEGPTVLGSAHDGDGDAVETGEGDAVDVGGVGGVEHRLEDQDLDGSPP